MTNFPEVIYLHDGQDDITWSEHEEVDGVKYFKASESFLLRIGADAIDAFMKYEMEGLQIKFPWISEDAKKYTRGMRHQSYESEGSKK